MLKESPSDKKAWKWFSLYIRLRDAIKTTGGIDFIKCCTCQKKKLFSEFDAGHYEKRGKQSTKYHEKNVHAQCRTCNRENEGEHNAYRFFMQLTYGQSGLDEIECLARRLKQHKDYELEELAEFYKDKVKKIYEKIKG